MSEKIVLVVNTSNVKHDCALSVLNETCLLQNYTRQMSNVLLSGHVSILIEMPSVLQKEATQHAQKPASRRKLGVTYFLLLVLISRRGAIWQYLLNEIVLRKARANRNRMKELDDALLQNTYGIIGYYFAL